MSEIHTFIDIFADQAAFSGLFFHKFPAGCSPDFKSRRTLPSVQAATVATSEHVLLNAWDDLGDIGAP
jgi:hypothetical protein